MIRFSAVAEDQNSTAEIAMQYTDSYQEQILSFANNIHTTDGGTHEDGFKRAFTRVMNDYAKKYNILKDNDKNLSGEDVREGLTCIISVKLKRLSLRARQGEAGQHGNERPGQRHGVQEHDDLSGGKPRHRAHHF